MARSGRSSRSQMPTTGTREEQARRAAAVPGMAYFVGTGPVRATCAECCHWQRGKPRYVYGQYFANADGRCDLVQGGNGPLVAGITDACKYYDDLAARRRRAGSV